MSAVVVVTVQIGSAPGPRTAGPDVEADLVLDATLPLDRLLSAVLQCCWPTGVVPTAGPWSWWDGSRSLEPDGTGLAAQGVLSGARLRLCPPQRSS